MMSMMTLERFDELAAAYGAAIFLWPAEEQAAAEAFAAANPEASAILARERALDEALDEWEAPQPSQAWLASRRRDDRVSCHRLRRRPLGHAGRIGHR